ncbi:uncharacterized protein LOC143028452 [Oratosquilla oratoria]|uniref:uncharacterized protein LOC143028452 n=1 Tax=Oratosquilla oratoria TaxID=337810 RepID=UPI003F7612F4
MTIVAASPPRNSLLPRTPAPWRPSNPVLGLPPAVETLLHQLGGTFHTYHPFRRNPATYYDPLPSNMSSTPNITSSNCGTYHDPSPLLLLCRNALISTFGLRRLRGLLTEAGAPRAVARMVSTISAGECQALGAAPLTDVFAQPFFHRAVTWRVTCCLDRQAYLTTYAATSLHHGYSMPWGGWHWSGWSADAWYWVNHAHLMAVWGVVYDDVTGNAFYLLDTPIATLDQIQTRLTACGCSVPEELVWTVVFQVASALQYILENDLLYPPLALDNIFLLRDRIALENMLSRKHRMTVCGCVAWRGAAGHQAAVASGQVEDCYVHHVGQIIFALITCHMRSHPEGTAPPNCSPVNTLRSLKHLYSPLLIRLLSRTLAGQVVLAWGSMGGGGEGRVAGRAAQWETRWEKGHHLQETPPTLYDTHVAASPGAGSERDLSDASSNYAYYYDSGGATTMCNCPNYTAANQLHAPELACHSPRPAPFTLRKSCSCVNLKDSCFCGSNSGSSSSLGSLQTSSSCSSINSSPYDNSCIIERGCSNSSVHSGNSTQHSSFPDYNSSRSRSISMCSSSSISIQNSVDMSDCRTTSNSENLSVAVTVTLTQIVSLARAEVQARRGCVSEAVLTSSQRLIRHVMSAQKTHLHSTRPQTPSEQTKSPPL